MASLDCGDETDNCKQLQMHSFTLKDIKLPGGIETVGQWKEQMVKSGKHQLRLFKDVPPDYLNHVLNRKLTDPCLLSLRAFLMFQHLTKRVKAKQQQQDALTLGEQQVAMVMDAEGSEEWESNPP